MDKVISPIHIDEYRITQVFGVNPERYAKYNMRWHNGIDLAGKTPGDMPELYSPVIGYVQEVGDQWNEGYGKFIRIRTYPNNGVQYEFVMAHLDSTAVIHGQPVDTQTVVGVMGTTGDSTGVHLHLWKRTLIDGRVVNHDNGFYGYYSFPIEPYSEVEEDEVEKRVDRYGDHFEVVNRSKTAPSTTYESMIRESAMFYELKGEIEELQAIVLKKKAWNT